MLYGMLIPLSAVMFAVYNKHYVMFRNGLLETTTMLSMLGSGHGWKIAVFLDSYM